MSFGNTQILGSAGSSVTPTPLAGVPPVSPPWATWVAPALLNSWTVAAGNQVGYLKDPQGFVHLRGQVTGGGNSTTVFILPPGFRPGQLCNFVTQGAAAGAANAIAVSTNGAVTAFIAAGGQSPPLDGITFLAEG